MKIGIIITLISLTLGSGCTVRVGTAPCETVRTVHVERRVESRPRRYRETTPRRNSDISRADREARLRAELRRAELINDSLRIRLEREELEQERLERQRSDRRKRRGLR